MIDRRPEGEWRSNASAAVLRLDTPMLKPDADAELLELRPSYADAMAKAPAGLTVLPSINVIDGKAKQFDDGLFAALDLAYYKGLKARLESHVSLIERIHARVRRKRCIGLSRGRIENRGRFSRHRRAGSIGGLAQPVRIGRDVLEAFQFLHLER